VLTNQVARAKPTTVSVAHDATATPMPLGRVAADHAVRASNCRSQGSGPPASGQDVVGDPVRLVTARTDDRRNERRQEPRAIADPPGADKIS
jgi:hypothetical protein